VVLSQHDGTALIEANNVERVLADIDADYGDCGVEFLRHGVLLVFGAPCQHRLLAGQEHGRTIPLADLGSGIIIRYASPLPRTAQRHREHGERCERRLRLLVYAPLEQGY